MIKNAKYYEGRFSAIFYICSYLIFLFSLSLIIPIILCVIYKERDITAFLITFAITFSIGFFGRFTKRSTDIRLRGRDGFLVVVIFWVLFSLMSAMPFLLDRHLNFSVADAIFEGVSGITTTGASVISQVDGTAKAILYYRAQLNFLGGLGIIVLATAVFNSLGIGGSKVYLSETPGPLKEDKLTPKLADTAKHLWFIYVALAVVCALSFYAAGMNAFDAICHSLATVALGGFSTHSASLGYYHSSSIEMVGGVFSLLAGVNFALYFLAVNRRSLKAIWQDAEFRFYLSVALAVAAFTILSLYLTHTYSFQEAFVHGFFQSASMMTDNGLMTNDIDKWPTYVMILLLASSFFGGCVGSTCGGIKAIRFLILYKRSDLELRQLINPRAIYLIKLGNNRVSERVTNSVYGLFFVYLMFAGIFIWVMLALGYDLKSAFGTVAACMNNMGIGYGVTGSTFGTLSDSAKWVMSAAMLFGRLEIFPILIVFSRSFWQP
ncbi:potassium transporter TrkG [Celerinatantimonas sp. MCCC 1A17872]|uniref:potassium transporter TrkG n=1 Tax=Celerinatantimonas sp. MCCC 1A17872 TaxID=3177514 RepID=UPI0038BEFE6A